eukprot:1158043-Pelagomonas_calceolata.AAC.1
MFARTRTLTAALPARATAVTTPSIRPPFPWSCDARSKVTGVLLSGKSGREPACKETLPHLDLNWYEACLDVGCAVPPPDRKLNCNLGGPLVVG